MEVAGIISGVVAVIVLSYKGISLGYAMLVATFLVAVLSGMGFSYSVQVLEQAVTDNMTITLVLAIILIGVLANLMKETNILDIMLKKLTSLLKDIRLLIIFIPALIGLLTVPGGAVLSAPMAGEAGNKVGMNVEKISAANVIYRHIGNLIFPLHPSLILLAEMSEVQIRKIIFMNFPVFVFALIVTFYFLFKGISFSNGEEGARNSYIKDFFSFFRSILPIITVLFLAIVFEFYLPYALMIGVIVAFVNYMDVTEKEKRISFSNLFSQFKQRFMYILNGINKKMVLAIIGIMVFRHFVEASGGVDTIASILFYLGLPSSILILITTFITGLFAGNPIASIGITYPILSPLISGSASVELLSLLFVGNLTGYILSPLHLCLIMTCEYLKAALKSTYLIMLPPVIIIVIGSFLYTSAWQLF